MSGTPPHWEHREIRTVFEGRFFRLQSHRCVHPDTRTEDDFFVVDGPDWVCAFALTKEEELVLVRQYRFGSRALSWEVPAGVIDPGEEPLEAGLRELLEESGYGGGEAQRLGWVHPNPALQVNRCHYVLVRGVQALQAPQWDAYEQMEVHTLPLPEARRWAMEGKITHGLVLAGLFRLQEALGAG